MLWLYFIILLTSLNAILKQISVLRGSYTTVLIYDPSQINNENYTFVFLNQGYLGDGATLYLVGVLNGKVPTVYCRESTLTQIIIAPKGCDHFNNEASSVLRTNCGDIPAGDFQSYWSYASNDINCRLSPSQLCLGPPYVISTQSYYDPIKTSDFDLLAGVLIISGSRPRCALQTTTRINIVLSTLLVTFINPSNQTKCSSVVLGGIYTVDTLSLQTGPYTFIQFGWNIILTNNTNNGLDVLITLITTPTFSQNGTLGLGINLQGNGNYSSCKFIITFIPLPRPLQLVPFIPLNEINYYKNQFPPVYYTSSVCSFGVGRLDFDTNRPLIPGVPENVPYGGYPTLKNKLGIPYQIDANLEFANVQQSCDSFYPFSETFNSFGFSGFDGPLYYRNAPDIFTCFAPFPFPELILQDGTLDSRAKQCHMLGGYIATQTRDVCSIDSWRVYCLKGWLYFDQRCWFKATDAENSNMKVPDGQAESICQQLNSHSTSTYKFSFTVKAWLERFYIYWNPTTTQTRVPIAGNNCECYSYLTGVTSCNCNNYYFPLCSYHVKDVPIYWTSTNYHPHTIAILQNGQNGVVMDNSQPICSCLAGSAGTYCEQRTCVAPVDIQLASVNQSLYNPLIAFFKTCYLHGTCNEADVHYCHCNTFYGPDANLYTGLFVSMPCLCPSLPISGSISILGIINGIEYLIPNRAICGGIPYGQCVIEGWNNGYCNCLTRWSLDEPAGFELALSGSICTCPMPHYFNNIGDVQEVLCNRRGTCCPLGERFPIGNIDSIRYCITASNGGCTCDIGFSGISCTSPIAYEIISSTSTQFDTNSGIYVYQQIPYSTNIIKVYLTGFANSVWIMNTNLPTSSALPCNLSLIPLEYWEIIYKGSVQRWNCYGNLGNQIWVNSSSLLVQNIYVFDLDFSPCGYNPNLYSARYFTIPQFRYYSNNTGGIPILQELQPFSFAQFGSTNAPCFCTMNYYGYTCNIGISAYRYDMVNFVYDPILCGSTTFPPRGSTYNDQCLCNYIGNDIHFNGSSCECAITDGLLLCGGVGKCRSPRFPSGYCSFDQELFLQDALLSPSISNQILPGGQIPSTYLFNSGFIYFNQSLFLVPFETKIQIFGLNISILYINQTLHPLFNVTIIPPSSFLILLTNYSIIVNTSFIHSLQFTNLTSYFTYIKGYGIYLNCEDNLGYPCIQSINYISMVDYFPSSSSSFIPLSNVILFYVDAYSLIPSGGFNYVGILNCADPIDRLIEDSLILKQVITIEESQCYQYQPINDFTGTIGLGYGLFHNLTNLDFRIDYNLWTNNHIQLLLSLVNNDSNCLETFNESVWYGYKQSSLLSGINLGLTGGINTLESDLPYTITTANGFAAEIRISPIFWSGVLQNQVAAYNYNFVLILYLDGYPICYFDVPSLVYLYQVSVGSAYTCYWIPVHTGQVLQPFFVNIFNSSDNYTLTYNVHIRYLPNETTDNFNNLKSMIYNNYTLPRNLFCPIPTSAPVPITLDKLQRFHKSMLSPRRCSISSNQCQLFNSSATCIMDINFPVQSWRSGTQIDDYYYSSIIGDEGGCDCNTTTQYGFFNSYTFCATCLPGYGPDTSFDYQQLQIFNDLFSSSSLFQGSIPNNISRCSLPSDTETTRPTTICGGKGYIYFYPTISKYSNITVFTTPYGDIITYKCLTIIFNNTVFTLITNSYIQSPDLLYYYPINSSSFPLTIIYGIGYYQGLSIINIGEQITCQEQSSIYYINYINLNTSQVISYIPRDFFTVYLL